MISSKPAFTSAGRPSTARSANSSTRAYCAGSTSAPRTFYEHDYGYPMHEHLYCQSCHKMIEFQYPGIDVVLLDICREHNFQMEGHSFLIRGVCTDCNRAKTTKRPLDLV